MGCVHWAAVKGIGRIAAPHPGKNTDVTLGPGHAFWSSMKPTACWTWVFRPTYSVFWQFCPSNARRCSPLPRCPEIVGPAVRFPRATPAPDGRPSGHPAGAVVRLEDGRGRGRPIPEHWQRHSRGHGQRRGKQVQADTADRLQSANVSARGLTETVAPAPKKKCEENRHGVKKLVRGKPVLPILRG